MSFFGTEDRALFLGEFGQDIPVKLSGVQVTTIRGILQHEVITDSPSEAEIGTSVLTLQVDQDEYNALGKTARHTFYLEGADHIVRGPALRDDSGFLKLQLTEA